jgi:hypothetical protein
LASSVINDWQEYKEIILSNLKNNDIKTYEKVIRSSFPHNLKETKTRRYANILPEWGTNPLIATYEREKTFEGIVEKIARKVGQYEVENSDVCLRKRTVDYSRVSEIDRVKAYKDAIRSGDATGIMCVVPKEEDKKTVYDRCIQYFKNSNDYLLDKEKGGQNKKSESGNISATTFVITPKDSSDGIEVRIHSVCEQIEKEFTGKEAHTLFHYRRQIAVGKDYKSKIYRLIREHIMREGERVFKLDNLFKEYYV